MKTRRAFNEAFFPIAAKEHRCEWCYENIEKAERHVHFVGVFNGDFQNWRMHEECYDLANENDEIVDGFAPGEGTRPTKGVPASEG